MLTKAALHRTGNFDLLLFIARSDATGFGPMCGRCLPGWINRPRKNKY